MGEENGEAPRGCGEREPGYTYSDPGRGAPVRFRKCVRCGSRDMKPEVAYTGTGFRGADDSGLVYSCPHCGIEARIPETRAMVMGGLYALVWAAIGGWFFIQGPLWYLRNLSYFDERGGFDLLLLDLVYIIFSFAAMAGSGWYMWAFLFGPLMSRLRHPVTREIPVEMDGDGLGGAVPADLRPQRWFRWASWHTVSRAMIVGFAAQFAFVALFKLAGGFDATGAVVIILCGLLWWIILERKLLAQAPVWLVIVFFFVFVVPTSMVVDDGVLNRLTGTWPDKMAPHKDTL